MLFKEISKKNRYRILFIVSSTAQVEMLCPLLIELHNYDVYAINIIKESRRSEMENSLLNLGICYETIDRYNPSCAKRLLDKIRPDIVIVGHDDTPMDRLFVKSAASMDIPTLLVQDGILGPNKHLLMKEARGIDRIGFCLKFIATSLYRVPRFVNRRDVCLPQKFEILWFELKYGARWNGVYPGFGECLKIAAFGETAKEFWISNGIDPGRVVVTGNPKFDRLYHSNSNNCRENVYKKWNIPTDKNIILLLTQYFVEAKIWNPEQRRLFVHSVANAVAELPNAQLIIKLHPPHEDVEDYNRIVKDLSSHPIICKYAPLADLLHACSLAITTSSTVALEAMALGKPVVIANLFGDGTGASFFKNCGAPFVERAEDILPAMQKILYYPKIRDNMMASMAKFVYQQAYLQDGQASKRIACLIRDLIASK